MLLALSTRSAELVISDSTEGSAETVSLTYFVELVISDSEEGCVELVSFWFSSNTTRFLEAEDEPVKQE